MPHILCASSKPNLSGHCGRGHSALEMGQGCGTDHNGRNFATMHIVFWVSKFIFAEDAFGVLFLSCSRFFVLIRSNSGRSDFGNFSLILARHALQLQSAKQLHLTSSRAMVIKPILAEEISENPCCSGNLEGLSGFAPICMIVGIRKKQRYPHE